MLKTIITGLTRIRSPNIEAMKACAERVRRHRPLVLNLLSLHEPGELGGHPACICEMGGPRALKEITLDDKQLTDQATRTSRIERCRNRPVAHSPIKSEW